MKHKEYIEVTEKLLPSIKKENILFWNAWCLNYVFEKIDPEFQHYAEFEESFNLLWELNDSDIELDEMLKNKSVKSIIGFDNDEFDDLDDFDISEKAVKEFIIGFESILYSLEEESETVFYANEQPINLIDTEIEGISITKDNENKVYLNEVNAQLKLIEDLSNSVSKYSKQDRNIYRIESEEHE